MFNAKRVDSVMVIDAMDRVTATVDWRNKFYGNFGGQDPCLPEDGSPDFAGWTTGCSDWSESAALRSPAVIESPKIFAAIGSLC
jgi:hypothetical protein